MIDKKNEREVADRATPTLSDDILRALAEEGRRLRKRFEARVAPLKVLDADDLRVRAR